MKSRGEERRGHPKTSSIPPPSLKTSSSYSLSFFIHSQEYVGGQLKNKYGDAFIRGNNGEF